jgi:GDP-L-fucose synthase
MNIFITGASGFIGKHLTEFFSEKYHLFTPAHTQLDLLDENAVLGYFQNHSIDVVIHCAVIGGNGPHQYVKGMFYDNLRIFFNLARCRKYYKRMINISSGAVYDKRFPIVKIKETDLGKRIPPDEYGLYKYICSEYIDQADNMTDLRVFGIFGEGEDYQHRFISNALCRYSKGLPITIKQNVYFDYLDVADFVKIVGYFILHTPKYKAYNVGSGKKIDLVSIAKKIIKLHGSKDHRIVIGKKLLNNEYSCDTKRLYEDLSQFKPTPLSQSLERLYTWYQHGKT